MKIRTAIAGFGLSGKIFQAPFIHADPNFELKRYTNARPSGRKRSTPTCRSSAPLRSCSPTTSTW